MSNSDSQAARTSPAVWDVIGEGLSKEAMDKRIKAAVSQRGWSDAVNIFACRGVPIDKLAVAEVGCGTGTTGLAFGLMGAAVTLIDNNEKVLGRTRRMYEEYGCQARFVKTDCLEDSPLSLRGAFDLVTSAGLAEHFSDENRKRCIRYHGQLAKTGGVISISVPNARSPTYNLVRYFRTMTRTWSIDVELPFSGEELRRLAAEEGLSGAYVVGYVDMPRDIVDGIRGLGYAVADALPERLAAFLRRWKKGGEASSAHGPTCKEDMRAYCLRAAGSARARRGPPAGSGQGGIYCSNIVLFAFK